LLGFFLLTEPTSSAAIIRGVLEWAKIYSVYRAFNSCWFNSDDFFVKTIIPCLYSKYLEQKIWTNIEKKKS